MRHRASLEGRLKQLQQQVGWMPLPSPSVIVWCYPQAIVLMLVLSDSGQLLTSVDFPFLTFPSLLSQSEAYRRRRICTQEVVLSSLLHRLEGSVMKEAQAFCGAYLLALQTTPAPHRSAPLLV